MNFDSFQAFLLIFRHGLLLSWEVAIAIGFRPKKGKREQCCHKLVKKNCTLILFILFVTLKEWILFFFSRCFIYVIDCNVRNAIYVLYTDKRCSKMNCKLHHEMSLEEKWIFILSNNFKLSSMQKKKIFKWIGRKGISRFFFLFHMLSKSNQIKALLFDQINRYLLFSGNVE